MNKLYKYLEKVKRDGLIKASVKSFKKAYILYFSKINIFSFAYYLLNRHKVLKEVRSILDKDQRLIILRGSLGYNIPLFQRPQQLFLELAKQGNTCFYEVTPMTEKVHYIKKQNDNLYLINFTNPLFKRDFHKLFFSHKEEHFKYLYITSTTWDIPFTEVNYYLKNDIKLIYDYLDCFTPKLLSNKSFSKDAIKTFDYVASNEDIICLVTASSLKQDMKEKRGSLKNIHTVSNGVNLNNFTNLNKKIKLSEDYEAMLKENKPIIGYYGAIASWLDYDLLLKLAKERPNYNICLIGAKYDDSFKKNINNMPNNIYYFEPKKIEELPYYARHFNVAMIPFLINEITEATNPIKLFEYMALEKPIVVTDLRECYKYKSVKIAKSRKEFIKVIDELVKPIDNEYKKLSIKEAEENSWQAKAEDITKIMRDQEDLSAKGN